MESLLQEHIRVNGSGRFVRLDILNEDDPPLEVEQLRILYQTEALIAQAPANPARPYLYFGSEFAAAPRFDLEARWNRLPTAPSLTPMHPGPPEVNPAHRAGLSGRLLRIIAILAIALTSALVLWVIYRMMTHPLGDPTTEERKETRE